MFTKRMNILSLVISLTFFLLISSPYIPQRVNNLIKLFIEFTIVVLLFMLEEKTNKKSLFNLIPVVIFSIACCYSTFKATGFSTRLFNAFVTTFSYVIFFLVFSIAKKGGSAFLINNIKTNLIFYIIILDFFVIVTRGKGIGGLREHVYLLGNKFMVSYFHMALLSILMMDKNKPHKVKTIEILLFFIYSLIICRITDTMTGVIGIVAIYLLYIVMKKRNYIFKLLTMPIAPVAFLLGTNALFLLSNIITDSFFRNFFLRFSHTDTLLSGRLVMYKLCMNAIAKKPIWGYGINYELVYLTLGFGNPQNGSLKMLLDFGIVGLGLFSYLLFFVFKQSKSCFKDYSRTGLIAFVYGMLLCSLVEINIEFVFYLFLALIINLENNDRNIEQNEQNSN